MPDRLRIALASFNPRMAAPEANAADLAALRARAAEAGADLLLTPAHSLSGAVPAALAADPGFAAACETALAPLATGEGPAMTVGLPWREGEGLYDAVLLLAEGALRGRRTAHHPRPGFDPGPVPGPLVLGDLRLGLMPGADWRDPAVPETLAETGAEILVALDSLPEETGGPERTLQAALARVVENGLPLMLVNRLGAEEESAHDGAALVLNADRAPALRTAPFTEALALTEWRREGDAWRCAPAPPPAPMGDEERLWQALILALRDHALRFAPAPILITLDEDPFAALTAALAVDAFGTDPIRVRAFLLQEGAAPLASRLGLASSTLDLGPALEALSNALPPAAPHLLGPLRRLAMDMLARAGQGVQPVCGFSACSAAFFPLRHLSPARCRALAEWRNAARPPGALGPEYPFLPLPADEPAPVERHDSGHTLWQSLARADYKRRLLPPGLNIAPRAFGQTRKERAQAP
ncbi:nitrilase-related carbon-nitrogen hydrolase [Pararoseomonas sp. SCSIO 73927]|uniref:nitrilase-related carbon-nitrogen hydrolase n=1 Tax=Pararoseomonas sp. SCSIO 73927 TaxID=3114537 RepID=UPI0030D4B412